MRQTARLFMNGRSQAVRLPSSFRFNSDKVYIRRDPESGDVILSRRPGTWDDFFKLLDTLDIPEDLIASRDKKPPDDRHLF